MNCESYVRIESKLKPGVEFVVAKMSFGRRLELIRRIREMSAKLEFLHAGASTGDQLEAALVSAEIDRLYVIWGLREVAGLDIDGVAATPELLVSAGPEDLFREAVTAVKNECGLSETERKN